MSTVATNRKEAPSLAPTTMEEAAPTTGAAGTVPVENAAKDTTMDGSTKEIPKKTGGGGGGATMTPEALAVASTQLVAASTQLSTQFNAVSNQILQKTDHFLQKSSPLMNGWKGRRPFLIAQGQIIFVLLAAYVVNNWPVSYPREDNHSDFLFWFMTLAMGAVAYATLKHEKGKRGVQLLSRAQTEEWKGWMQFVFIMYHYYRNRAIYNEIRLLVSAYVWMTGFGHFLYCDKKQDFSIERMVSMWVRINYFPLLLSWFLGVPLELYYVVPLHTVGFFMALGTCYLAKILREKFPQHCPDSTKANAAAIGISLLVHMIFFETSLHTMVLGLFSKEYVFRFSTDKYSAWVGVLSGFMWSRFQAYMQWCYGDEEDSQSSLSLSPSSSEAGEVSNNSNNDNVGNEGTAGVDPIPPTSPQAKTSKPQSPKKFQAQQIQRGVGVALLLVWYFGFGSESDKHKYNPQHPYVFWMPVAGFLMLRNSSKYLTELHSTALEFIGRITLETYVLQFHVFMCKNVQYIPVIIPGSGANGFAFLQFANMLLTGVGFVGLSWYARRATVTTQNAITELVTDIRKKHFASSSSSSSGGTGETGGDDGGGPMKTKPTLGIIEDPEETIPLNPVADKKDEQA